MLERIKVNNMDTIKVTPVIEGETYPRTMSIEGSIVHVKQTTDLKDGVHYIEHAVETKNMTDDEKLKHCVHDVIIKAIRARLLKKLTSKEVEKLGYVIDPTDYPATGGAGITTKERNIRFMVDTMGLSRDVAEHYADNPNELKEAAQWLHENPTKEKIK